METAQVKSKGKSVVNDLSIFLKVILWILKKLFIHKKKCCE